MCIRDSRDRAVDRVGRTLLSNAFAFDFLTFPQITWGQPPPAVRWSEAPLFSAVPFIPMNSRAALDRTAVGGGCPHVVLLSINPFPITLTNAGWVGSTSTSRGRVI